MKYYKSALLAALLGLSAIPALSADTKDIVLDTKSGAVLPYAIDQRGVVVRDNFGLCWRTGYWTKELASKTPVVGEQYPAGCFCERDLMDQMDKTICEAPKPAEAPPPMPEKPAAVKPTAEKITLSADALFDFDKAKLRPEGIAKLDDVVSKLPDIKLEVILATGHADRFGTDSYNQKLSERRANAVKDYLVSKGVDANRVYAEGKGKTQPKTQPDECKGKKSKKVIACLQPDRRVDIEIIGTQESK